MRSNFAPVGINRADSGRIAAVLLKVLKLNRFAAVLGKTMGRRSGKDEPPPLQRFTLS
jgi:hypothetical protein